MKPIWLNHYPQDVPAEVDSRRYASLVDLFAQSCERFRVRPAFSSMGVTLSYDEIDRKSRAFAAYLQQTLGLQKGERVVIMLPNLLFAALAGAALLLPPVAQPLYYHDFADQRACGPLPNCLDTASNLLFALAGAAGLVFLRRAAARAFIDAREAAPYALFFAAVILIGMASAWYHLAPDNTQLAWDRAAMALAFMAWFAAILGERVGPTGTKTCGQRDSARRPTPVMIIHQQTLLDDPLQALLKIAHPEPQRIRNGHREGRSNNGRQRYRDQKPCCQSDQHHPHDPNPKLVSNRTLGNEGKLSDLPHIVAVEIRDDCQWNSGQQPPHQDMQPIDHQS